RGAHRSHQHGFDTAAAAGGRASARRLRAERRGGTGRHRRGRGRHEPAHRSERGRGVQAAPGRCAVRTRRAGCRHRDGRWRLMELQHRFTVPASLETTWESFNDVEYIAPCFPGASLTSVEGDEFKGTVKVKLG